MPRARGHLPRNSIWVPSPSPASRALSCPCYSLSIFSKTYAAPSTSFSRRTSPFPTLPQTLCSTNPSSMGPRSAFRAVAAGGFSRAPRRDCEMTKIRQIRYHSVYQKKTTHCMSIILPEFMKLASLPGPPTHCLKFRKRPLPRDSNELYVDARLLAGRLGDCGADIAVDMRRGLGDGANIDNVGCDSDASI